MRTVNIPATSLAPTGVTRRDLLAGGAALLAGSMVLRGSLSVAPDGLRRLADSPGPRVSLALVEGGGTTIADVLGAGATVRPATGLRAGASELAGRPLAVRLLGATSVLDSLDRVAFDSLVPSPDPFADGATIPFYAWSYARQPVRQASSPTRFGVAPATDLRLGLSLTVTPVGSEPVTSTTVLTSGRRSDLPKVHPGTYLVSLRGVDWSQHASVPPLGDPAWDGELASLVMTISAA